MFHWKRLFLIAGLLAFFVLLVRGCLFACVQTPVEMEPDVENRVLRSGPILSVYMHKPKKTVSMGLEVYLIGVVAAEMPAGFEEEALKAQAVAARTYTLRRIDQGGCSSGKDICTNSACCQAYDDMEACRKKWGNNYERNIGKVTEAVQATQGQALFYEGALIEALYHAASGGYTEDSENVFAAAQPYLRSVESGHEVGSEHLTDTEKFTKKDFAKKINAAFGKANVKASKLQEQIKVLERYESGRVKEIRLGGALATGRELRNALKLRSAWFDLEFSGDTVYIHTKGYGHGVGMSQTGANGMAMEGANYQEILEHYYTGAEIRQDV